MAFKLYVPTANTNWEDYWNQTSIKKNALDCETDGLLPILYQYLPPNGKILEAGCGLGKWVIYLRKHNYDIFGVDSYESAVKTLKKYDRNFPVSVDSVEKLHIPGQSLDAYLSFGVIEHFEQGPQKALQEAYRVLKNGGVAIVETPYDNPLRQIVRLINAFLTKLKLPAKFFVEELGLRAKRVTPEKHFYEYHYTKKELEKFVKNAGFKILDSKPKDDLSSERSIGLWIDFPSLRNPQKDKFYLNRTGRLLKILLQPFPWFWSACVVVIAQKK